MDEQRLVSCVGIEVFHGHTEGLGCMDLDIVELLSRLRRSGNISFEAGFRLRFSQIFTKSLLSRQYFPGMSGVGVAWHAK
ncbi:hypothetical protein AB833_24870 [Chromatiales bacterium (ex Bugula neritina AB1)]|nr:hypothetical protein AB833_24870 [Chromatiales bacterium (ex Bugula neritina AB1)]